eukprot:scaffold125719_cov28-Tisochrysis_lutea.AAC.1
MRDRCARAVGSYPPETPILDLLGIDENRLSHLHRRKGQSSPVRTQAAGARQAGFFAPRYSTGCKTEGCHGSPAGTLGGPGQRAF